MPGPGLTRRELVKKSVAAAAALAIAPALPATPEADFLQRILTETSTHFRALHPDAHSQRLFARMESLYRPFIRRVRQRELAGDTLGAKRLSKQIDDYSDELLRQLTLSKGQKTL